MYFLFMFCFPGCFTCFYVSSINSRTSSASQNTWQVRKPLASATIISLQMSVLHEMQNACLWAVKHYYSPYDRDIFQVIYCMGATSLCGKKIKATAIKCATIMCIPTFYMNIRSCISHILTTYSIPTVYSKCVTSFNVSFIYY